MPALAAVSTRLRCPHCDGDLTPTDRTLGCARGHSFDIARHGHVSLLAAGRKAASGDSEEMVAARDAFLGAGHYAPIATAVAAAARASGEGRAGGCAVDLGAGTGYYLSVVIGQLHGWHGLALDSSRPALRRAVRADPRIAGVVCDAWGPLPVKAGAADLVLSVFAPRQAVEVARILAARGRLVVVTPVSHHLGELVSALGLISVDPEKPARLHAQLSPHLRRQSAARVEFELALDHEMVLALAGMGPSAHHIAPAELRDRVDGLPETVRVTSAVIVETFSRLDSAA